MRCEINSVYLVFLFFIYSSIYIFAIFVVVAFIAGATRNEPVCYRLFVFSFLFVAFSVSSN